MNLNLDQKAALAELHIEHTNTEVHYTYRDANNYKSGRTVVLEGLPTIRDVIELLDACDKSNGNLDIIPGLVGLDDLQIEMTGGFDEEADHPFHEIESITPTAADADAELPSFAAFKSLVIERGGKDGSSWDEKYRPGRQPAAHRQQA